MRTGVVAAVMLGALLQGCGTISGSRFQNIAVSTFNEDMQEDGVECILKNPKGEWRVMTQGTVVIQRSYGEMAVTCTKDGLPDGEAVLHSTASDSWPDFMAGGSVGTAVDSITQAAFAYPRAITVYMGRKIEYPTPRPSAP